MFYKVKRLAVKLEKFKRKSCKLEKYFSIKSITEVKLGVKDDMCLSSDENTERSFQPRLVIFRAEPSIDASIGTFVPSKCVSSLVPQ